jgi:hypothetical protein
LDVVHMRVGGDFTCQNHQAGVAQGLSSNAAAWVLLENCVERPCLGGLQRRIRM